MKPISSAKDGDLFDITNSKGETPLFNVRNHTPNRIIRKGPYVAIDSSLRELSEKKGPLKSQHVFAIYKIGESQHTYAAITSGDDAKAPVILPGRARLEYVKHATTDEFTT